MAKARNENGFTLLEALAASVILALTVASICALSMRSLSQVTLNRQYEKAWQIIDQQFCLLEDIGIMAFLAEGNMAGPVSDELNQGGRTKYFWQAELNDEDMDNLYLVKFTISWQYKKKMESVCAVTMLNAQKDM